MVDRQVKCVFVSVWDGGIAVESDALFDIDTGIVSDIQTANLPEGILNELEHLDKEYIRVGRQTYDVQRKYAVVQAASPEEARRIADEELKYDDVSWDDDWHPTDVQLEE